MTYNHLSKTTLREIVANLRSFDDEQSVFLDRSERLSPETHGAVVWYSEIGKEPPEVAGLKCFMDIWQIKDVLKGKASLLGLTAPTVEQQVEMLVSFAVKGA